MPQPCVFFFSLFFLGGVHEVVGEAGPKHASDVFVRFVSYAGSASDSVEHVVNFPPHLPSRVSFCFPLFLFGPGPTMPMFHWSSSDV